MNAGPDPASCFPQGVWRLTSRLRRGTCAMVGEPDPLVDFADVGTGLRAKDGCTDRSYRVARDCSVFLDLTCPRSNAVGTRIGTMWISGTLRASAPGALVGILDSRTDLLDGRICFSAYDVTGQPNP
jgi:hypothetical protein